MRPTTSPLAKNKKTQPIFYCWHNQRLKCHRDRLKVIALHQCTRLDITLNTHLHVNKLCYAGRGGKKWLTRFLSIILHFATRRTFNSWKASLPLSLDFRLSTILMALFCRTRTCCRFPIVVLPYTAMPYRRWDSKRAWFAVLAVNTLLYSIYMLILIGC